MSEQPITSLKGIGEKTGRLFEKLGVETVRELLEYYPRGYDAYEPPVAIGDLKPDSTAAVEGILKKDGDVRRFSRIAVTVAPLEDATGIHIEEEEAAKLKTVADVTAYLESKQA